MANSIDRLFVYGTLAPGRTNHHVIEHIKGEWSAGQVKGKLVQAGWGAEHGCPGMVVSTDGDYIDGHILSSDTLVQNWPMLDEFEGSEYQRTKTSARVQQGSLVEVWVYALKVE